MKPNLKLLVLLALVSSLSFSQVDDNPSVDIIPVPVLNGSLETNAIPYNPNGVKIFYDTDPNFVNIKFNRLITGSLIEVIDLKGRMINDYKASEVRQIKINLARLNSGQYYVRIISNEIKDFLKITKN